MTGTVRHLNERGLSAPIQYARACNVVPQGQLADNILKGKVICGCCGGKMQRKRGTGHANIRNSAYKQKIQEYTGQIANLTQHKTTAWINAMEHYEKYVQEEISKEEFRAVQDVQTKQKKFLLRQKNANLPMKNNTPDS